MTQLTTWDPTNSYTTAHGGNAVLSSGNTLAAHLGNSIVVATLGKSSGKLYFEVTVTPTPDNPVDSTVWPAVGVMSASVLPIDQIARTYGGNTGSFASYASPGGTVPWAFEFSGPNGTLAGSGIVPPATIGIAVDLDAGTMHAIYAGVVYDLGTLASVTPPSGRPLVPAVWDYSSGSGTNEYSINTTGPFTYSSSIPAGYGPWEPAVAPFKALFNISPVTAVAILQTVSITDESTAPSGGSIASYDYDWGDGTAHATTQNPTHQYALPGTYTIIQTITTSDSRTDTCTKTVKVVGTPSGGAPIASFTASPTSGASPLAVTFTDASNGVITSRAWDFGDGNTSTATNPSHTYANNGVYTVKLTCTGPGGTNSFSSTIYVGTQPVQAVVNVTPGISEFPLTVATENLTPVPHGSTISSHDWDWGDGSVHSTTATPTHTYQSPGTYEVVYIVTFSDSRTATWTVPVIVTGKRV